MRNHQPSTSLRFLPQLVLSLTGALAVLALTAPVLHAAPVIQETAGEGQKAWPVFLLLLGASFGIERGLEIIWNYLEWLMLNFRATRAVDLKSPHYLQFKSGTSLVLGAIVGILVVNITGMRLFQYLQPLAPTFLGSVPPLWDAIFTGVLIGVGAKPIHDVLTLVTEFKNLMGSAAIKQREMASAALADGVLKLAQSEAQAMIEVPGVGPARIEVAMGAAGPQPAGAEGAPAGMTSAAEGYMDMLHNRTAV